MPWQNESPMDQKEKFIRDTQRDAFTMPELCERYGISRKTGYKWLGRFQEEGWAGLKERSRAPQTCPHRIDEVVAKAICDARRKHPTWGARKILDWMSEKYPRMALPAQSTAHDLLKRNGLIKKRRRRFKGYVHPGVVPDDTTGPNDIWAADFKGQFKTKDGIYCYPLTITDVHSRYIISIKGLLSTRAEGAFQGFDRAFREFGLPKAIRTDNGVPFATVAIHGLSHLNVWWIRLGIQHQRILPASPQQNGKHERMHRTMKAEATRPARANLNAQQREFNRFRKEYNEERPHEAIGGKTPSKLYRPSKRIYTGKIEPYEYPAHFVIKKVTSGGTIRLGPKLVFLANSLPGEIIGLEEVADGIWSIYLCNVLLARIDQRDYILHP